MTRRKFAKAVSYRSRVAIDDGSKLRAQTPHAN